MDILCQIQEIALQSSLFETGYVEISHLRYYPEVRAACEKKCLPRLRHYMGLSSGSRYAG